MVNVEKMQLCNAESNSSKLLTLKSKHVCLRKTEIRLTLSSGWTNTKSGKRFVSNLVESSHISVYI